MSLKESGDDDAAISTNTAKKKKEQTDPRKDQPMHHAALIVCPAVRDRKQHNFAAFIYILLQKYTRSLVIHQSCYH